MFSVGETKLARFIQSPPKDIPHLNANSLRSSEVCRGTTLESHTRRNICPVKTARRTRRAIRKLCHVNLIISVHYVSRVHVREWTNLIFLCQTRFLFVQYIRFDDGSRIGSQSVQIFFSKRAQDWFSRVFSKRPKTLFYNSFVALYLESEFQI